MLEDCETCIRTCSARHTVGLRVVGRVLSGRTIHACGRRQWRRCVLPGPARHAVRLSDARRVLACTQTTAKERQRVSSVACAERNPPPHVEAYQTVPTTLRRALYVRCRPARHARPRPGSFSVDGSCHRARAAPPCCSPAGQFVHSALPSASLYLPSGHAVQSRRGHLQSFVLIEVVHFGVFFWESSSKNLIGTGGPSVCWIDHKTTPFDNLYRGMEKESRKSHPKGREIVEQK